jgi:hypothetical protein
MNRETTDETISADQTAAAEAYERPVLIETFSIEELRSDAALNASIVPK